MSPFLFSSSMLLPALLISTKVSHIKHPPPPHTPTPTHHPQPPPPPPLPSLPPSVRLYTHSSVFVQRYVSSFSWCWSILPSYLPALVRWVRSAWQEQLCSSTWLLQSPPPLPPPLCLTIFLVLFSNFSLLSTLFFFPPPILPHHSRSWVNLYCVLNKGEIGFYKDAKNTSTPYNNEPLLNLSHCHCDITNGYKKKKNVFTLKWESFFLHHFSHYLPMIMAPNVHICSTISNVNESHNVRS